MIVTVNGIKVDGAHLLMQLHNRTRPLGLGVLHDIGEMSLSDARDIIEESEVEGRGFSFDYVHGRPIKVFARDGVIDNGRLYDRDAGEGRFQEAVDAAVRSELDHEESKYNDSLADYYGGDGPVTLREHGQGWYMWPNQHPGQLSQFFGDDEAGAKATAKSINDEDDFIGDECDDGHGFSPRDFGDL